MSHLFYRFGMTGTKTPILKQTRNQTYQLVADATSEHTADKFNDLVGGMAVFLPAEVDADHWLSIVVGQHDAQIICNLFANGFGSTFDFPIGRNSNSANVREHVAVLLSETPIKSVNEIAMAAGCSRRTVQRVKHRLSLQNQSSKTRQD